MQCRIHRISWEDREGWLHRRRRSRTKTSSLPLLLPQSILVCAGSAVERFLPLLHSAFSLSGSSLLLRSSRSSVFSRPISGVPKGAQWNMGVPGNTRVSVWLSWACHCLTGPPALALSCLFLADIYNVYPKTDFFIRILFFFSVWHVAYGILVSRSGIKPRPSSLGVQSFSLWTTREIPAQRIW